MKNSNDTMGNRTRGLPAWSAVSQPTAPLLFRMLALQRYYFSLKTNKSRGCTLWTIGKYSSLHWWYTTCRVPYIRAGNSGANGIFAEVGTEYTCSQVINYVYVYTRKVQLKSKTSSTKAPARLQHEISVTFAIAQQCSSDTYVSLSFHSCKEN